MVLDRKNAPKIHDAISFDYALPLINQDKLDNGTPFYWLNAGVQDVVEVDWVFPAGVWQEPKEGVAQATSQQLKSGTSTKTSQEINEALEFYGASLRVRAGNDTSTVSLFTLTKHLHALLPIVHELLTDATFPEEELNIYKQNTLQRLLVSLRKCDFVSNQLIDAAVFGEEHPYGRFTKRESIEAITQEDIKGFYKNNYDLSKVKIFMAGKIGKKETQQINDLFGKNVVEHTSDKSSSSFEIKPITNRKQAVDNDPNGLQGAIRIARRFPNRHHEDFPALVVTNTLFGGYFGSRLMSNIREDKGYTYGIYSSMTPMINDGSLTIQTEVGKDVVKAAIDEVYKEMDMLCNEKPADDELLLVKNYLLGNLLGDLDGPFSILQRWRTIILHGLSIDTFDRNIEVYKSLTPTQVLDQAQKYFNKADFHEVVVI
ncbi:MAG: pitrilysin family protein [Flavipsychrobacter sp.]